MQLLIRHRYNQVLKNKTISFNYSIAKVKQEMEVMGIKRKFLKTLYLIVQVHQKESQVNQR